MKQNKRSLILWLVLIVVLAVASVLTGTPGGESESVKAVMRDAVLHETGQVSLFGIMDVNPGLISAYVVTAALLVLAVCLRIFAVPHFTEVPGKLQMLLELWVDTFRGMAEKNSPHNNKVLSAGWPRRTAPTTTRFWGPTSSAQEPMSLSAPCLSCWVSRW